MKTITMAVIDTKNCTLKDGQGYILGAIHSEEDRWPSNKYCRIAERHFSGRESKGPSLGIIQWGCTNERNSNEKSRIRSSKQTFTQQLSLLKKMHGRLKRFHADEEQEPPFS